MTCKTITAAAALAALTITATADAHIWDESTNHADPNVGVALWGVNGRDGVFVLGFPRLYHVRPFVKRPAGVWTSCGYRVRPGMGGVWGPTLLCGAVVEFRNGGRTVRAVVKGDAPRLTIAAATARRVGYRRTSGDLHMTMLRGWR